MKKGLIVVLTVFVTLLVVAVGFFGYNYFNDKSYGYAIELEVVERFDIPKPITDFGISNPPQSFCYLKNFNGKY